MIEIGSYWKSNNSSSIILKVIETRVITSSLSGFLVIHVAGWHKGDQQVIIEFSFSLYTKLTPLEVELL